MQCGTPLEIYDRPDNVFTARFIGTPHMNLLPAKISIDGKQIEFEKHLLDINDEFRQAAQSRRGQEITLGIRPEHIGHARDVDWQHAQTITGPVEMVELLGHEVIVHMRIGSHIILGRLRSHSNLPALGESISMQIKSDAMHLFDSVSEQRLR